MCKTFTLMGLSHSQLVAAYDPRMSENESTGVDALDRASSTGLSSPGMSIERFARKGLLPMVCRNEATWQPKVGSQRRSEERKSFPRVGVSFEGSVGSSKHPVEHQ